MALVFHRFHWSALTPRLSWPIRQPRFRSIPLRKRLLTGRSTAWASLSSSPSSGFFLQAFSSSRTSAATFFLASWARILGMIAEASGLYIPDPKLGTFSVFPNLSAGLAAFIPLNPLPVWGKMDFSSVFSLDFFAVIFAFLFVDLFDTLGTLIGLPPRATCSTKGPSAPHQRSPHGRLRRNLHGRPHGNKYGHDLC